MKTIIFAILATIALSTAGFAEEWTCKAGGMKYGFYDGGKAATILLEGFSSPGSYAVTQSGKDKVQGTTRNGTKFECTKKAAKT